MTVFIRRLPLLLAAGACGLAALLPAAASAQEAYRGYQGYRLPMDRYPVSRNGGYAVTPARMVYSSETRLHSIGPKTSRQTPARSRPAG